MDWAVAHLSEREAEVYRDVATRRHACLFLRATSGVSQRESTAQRQHVIIRR